MHITISLIFTEGGLSVGDSLTVFFSYIHRHSLNSQLGGIVHELQISRELDSHLSPKIQ